MKPRFWNSDWFLGLAITIVFVIAAGTPALQGLERIAYDWGVRATDRAPSDRIAVIAIDDASIANIGRWPWPRDIHAEMIRKLSASGAKVIGETVYFLEPQRDPGMTHIQQLIEFVSNASFSEVPADIDTLSALLEGGRKDRRITQIRQTFAESALATRLPRDIDSLKARLIEAEQALDTDSKLSAAIAEAGNVVLAMPFIIGEPRGRPDQPLPDYVLANAIPNIYDRIGAQSQGLFPVPTIDAIPPIETVGKPALAIGHLNLIPDIDGAIRSEALVLRHYDRFYPSIALQLAAHSLNLGVEDIRINLAESVEMGSLSIKTDRELLMKSFYYANRPDGRPAFAMDSFYDVFAGKIPLQKYKDKIVLIGATATGVGSAQVTPIDAAMPPVLELAHVVSSILNEDFFIEPEWGIWATLGAFLLVALYLMLLMPRLKAGVAAALTLLLLLGLILTHYLLMTTQTQWVLLMTPAALLVVGHLLITTRRFFITERGKQRSDIESSESNRMLGIAFQSQGQLDMAFEKFRKCAFDDQLMEALYSLALDFERKRQFNKAAAVYQYMAKHDADFRDIRQREQRALKMDETVMLGSGGHKGGSLLLDGSDVEKPMLGRYQVEKELGKGAMGVVYLGRDPKISRVVAIKTLALAEEFEPEELDEVKSRFFREAETAGRLSHPNIVTIYDAGEEHDLAYIAMEFLKGQDLVRYTRPDRLMPMDRVVSILIRAARALDYAHRQNVVHRDIKPANLMYEPDSDTLKITDFGIARITDSSKTKTGMVLGTPSYMSPEQLAGKKVDGRSDLFSLGVMAFQLFTGSLPFKAESMASLMFKITNEDAPDLRHLRPDAPSCLAAIVDRMLRKQVAERYQTGEDLAHDLELCRMKIRS
jgi:serine/threonine-protein kinase